MTPRVPLLTYFDDATGERTALTASELGDMAAATSALLLDGCRLAPGSKITVRLPPHWQTAGVLLGAWAAGMSVAYEDWGTAGLRGPGPVVDAAFVSAERQRSFLEDPPVAQHRFVLGLEPHGRPTPTVPDGYRDYLASLRPYAAAAPPRVDIRPGDPAGIDGTTYGSLGAIATAVAAQNGITKGDRVLIDAAESEEPMMWLLAPLSVGASVVLCANLDRQALRARVAAERVSRVL